MTGSHFPIDGAAAVPPRGPIATTDPLLPLGGRDPEAVALVATDGSPCTYEGLWATHARGAATLSEWVGQRSAPRLLSLLPDEPSSALAILSATRCASVAPVNPALADAELEEYTTRLRPNAALVRADRPDDRARIEALGLEAVTVVPRLDGHCADFDLVPAGRPFRANGGSPDERRHPGLVLSTSGSTGTPKLVPLTSEQMLLSARNIAGWLTLGANDRALHMLPMFHVGAFVDLVLAPLVAGGSVHFGHPVSVERLARAMTEGHPTWLQLVPTMLHRLLAHDDPGLGEAAARLRFVRTVSADLAPALQKRARDVFRDVPIIQMYGMTETAGQITSNPLPPGEPRPGSVGLPAGPEVAIMDDHANPRSVGEIGEVCVSGPTVMSGYLDHDNSGVFHGRWLRTGDLGHLDESGFLTLTGRRKAMINRGGEKIAPVEIERVLMAHPDVLEAAAFGVEHPTLGEEPMAAVVAAPGGHLETASVLEHAAGRLADFKRPRRIVLLDSLPRLGSGKIDRTRLRTLLTHAAPASGLPSPPRSGVGRALSEIWAETLECAPPGPESDFFDDGGDSLAATSFVVRVESTLRVTLPANLLFETPRFSRLEEAISALPRTRAPDDPLVRAVRRATAGWAGVRAGPRDLLVGRRTIGSMTPFFFISPGLTGVEDLLEAFHPERPLYLMRTLSKLRTRFGRRLKTDANNRRLADLYRDSITSVQPTGPVLLGGFCQGADVARRVAAALEAAGRQVALVGVIDRLFTDPVPWRAAVVWTAGSEYSGDTQFEDSERHLDLLYPAGCSVLHLAADHLDALQGAYAQQVADFLETEFACSLEYASVPGGTSAGDGAERLTRRRGAHTARIRLTTPRFAHPGQPISVHARVTNTSSASWNDPDDDGFMLVARWLNLDGHIRTQRSGRARLPSPVRPGETVSLDLEVPFPDRGLPMLLMVDVVDDGLNWFHWVGGRPGYRLVWPAPTRRRNGSSAGHR